MAPPSLPPELHSPGAGSHRPVSPPSKWQIAGWFNLTRAGRVTQYALMEAWAVICATASLIWRAIQYGAALGRLGLRESAFRRSQLDLESRCIAATSGPGRARVDPCSGRPNREGTRGQAIGCKAPRQRREPAHRPCCHIAVVEGTRFRDRNGAKFKLDNATWKNSVRWRQDSCRLPPHNAVEIRRVVLGFGAVGWRSLLRSVWSEWSPERASDPSD